MLKTMKELNDFARKNKTTTACFTGRRAKKLCGWRHESYQGLVDRMSVIVRDLYEKGIRNFISGGAQGFDQLAFWTVHKAKTKLGCKDLKNIAVIPFEGQDERWQENGCFGRKEYRLMLSLADEVFVCGPKDGNIAGRLMLRNHAMVDASCLVVALYDGKDAYKTAKSGGTEECMKYADSKGVGIMALDYEIVSNVVGLR